MINLLPDEEKRQLRAAHTNAVVIWYIILSFAGIVFLGGVLGVSYHTLSTQKTNEEAVTIQNKTKASNAYGQTQAQATQLASSLSEARTVLSNNVSYSKLLVDIAGDMPAGTILSELNVTSATIANPVALQFEATNNTVAQSLVTSLRADSSLFRTVTLSTMDSSGTVAGYPVAVQLQVTFNTEAVR